MEIIEILGYCAALLIGLTLGLIGGGGSILAVPVLAYLFMFDDELQLEFIDTIYIKKIFLIFLYYLDEEKVY